MPLRAAIWLGFAVTGLTVLYAASVMVRWLAGDPHLVVGWASTIIVVSFLSGMNMVLTGLMGLYVGRIYNEVKRRPLYVVSERVGFAESATSVTTGVSRAS